MGDNLKKTDAETGCDFKGFVNRCFAYSPFGNVDYAAQPDVVVRIVDNGQIRNGVPDFSALIEPEAADNTVRDTCPDHSALD